MTDKSRGIVLHQVKYSDSSLIVKIYTETHGLQSFLVKGVYGRHSRFRPALFQLLTLVELVADFRPNKDLHFLKELGVDVPFTSIPFSVQKNTIVYFLSELLLKTIKEHEANPALFGFIHQSIEWFDLVKENYVDFHLFFALELTRHLGFYPKLEAGDKGEVFDLLEGVFRKSPPAHFHYIASPLSESFAALCRAKTDDLDKLGFDNACRRKLLQEIIHFYRLHIPGFNEMKSPDILREMLSS
ncbi:MAG: DNA repair protein RecO [Bacteroidetes bacterium]|nr:DNA repair protein RecO [Bacteroidota bacterium]